MKAVIENYLMFPLKNKDNNKMKTKNQKNDRFEDCLCSILN